MKSYRAGIYLTLLPIALALSSYCQTSVNGTSATAKRLDALIQKQVSDLNIPGYSIAVIHKGETVLQKGYGFSDVENKIPVTPQTIFGLASVTKTFTALALLMLIDDGNVGIDDPLSNYFDNLSPAYETMTIRQVANMSAGIPHESAQANAPWKEQIVAAQQETLAATPGTEYIYSNLAYRILGGVIEKASGQSYMQFLNTRLLVPLKMSHTTPTDDASTTLLATPYTYKGGQLSPLKKYKPSGINFAAGMLASNTDDLANYARALMDMKLLSKKSYDLLWKERMGLPDNTRNGKPSVWAFGWSRSNINRYTALGMNGSLPGVTSSILLVPEDGLIVIGLSNIQKTPGMLVQQVALAFYGVED